MAANDIGSPIPELDPIRPILLSAQSSHRSEVNGGRTIMFDAADAAGFDFQADDVGICGISAAWDSAKGD